MFILSRLCMRVEQIIKQTRFGTFLLLLLMSIGVLLSALPANAQNPSQAARDVNIYMPLIPGGGSAVTPAATLATGARVYGLLGQLEQPTGRRFTYYLRTAGSGYYALAGQTPEIEQQIADDGPSGHFARVRCRVGRRTAVCCSQLHKCFV